MTESKKESLSSEKLEQVSGGGKLRVRVLVEEQPDTIPGVNTANNAGAETSGKANVRV